MVLVVSLFHILVAFVSIGSVQERSKTVHVSTNKLVVTQKQSPVYRFHETVIMSRQCGKFNLPHKHRWVNYVYAIRSSYDGSKVLMLVRESVPGSHNGDVYSVYLVDVSRGISEEGNEVQHYICLAAYREIPNWTTIPIAMNENGTVVAVGDPNNRIVNVYEIYNVSNKDSLTENHTLYADADDVAIVDVFSASLFSVCCVVIFKISIYLFR